MKEHLRIHEKKNAIEDLQLKKKIPQVNSHNVAYFCLGRKVLQNRSPWG